MCMINQRSQVEQCSWNAFEYISPEYPKHRRGNHHRVENKLRRTQHIIAVQPKTLPEFGDI